MNFSTSDRAILVRPTRKGVSFPEVHQCLTVCLDTPRRAAASPMEKLNGSSFPVSDMLVTRFDKFLYCVLYHIPSTYSRRRREIQVMMNNSKRARTRGYPGTHPRSFGPGAFLAGPNLPGLGELTSAQPTGSRPCVIRGFRSPLFADIQPSTKLGPIGAAHVAQGAAHGPAGRGLGKVAEYWPCKTRRRGYWCPSL